MTDLSSTLEVTESPPVLKRVAEKSITHRVSPAQDHWSQRVPDALGAALRRLNGKQKPTELCQSVVTDEQTVAAREADEIDTTPAILPHPAVVQIEEPAAPPAPTDRRRFPRRQSECSVSIVERQQVEGLTPRETDWVLRSSQDVGRLLDISQSGVCMQLSHAISVGSEVLLRISNGQLNRHVDSAATVVHCHNIVPQKYSVHCQVLFDFTLDQLQDLGRPALSSHALA